VRILLHLSSSLHVYIPPRERMSPVHTFLSSFLFEAFEIVHHHKHTQRLPFSLFISQKTEIPLANRHYRSKSKSARYSFRRRCQRTKYGTQVRSIVELNIRYFGVRKSITKIRGYFISALEATVVPRECKDIPKPATW
jgi:hypothetical protein